MGKRYQYHVHNEYISIIVTVPVELEEYAASFAKRTALDFYKYTEEQLTNLTVDFLCSFSTESVINVKRLKN